MSTSKKLRIICIVIATTAILYVAYRFGMIVDSYSTPLIGLQKATDTLLNELIKRPLYVTASRSGLICVVFSTLPILYGVAKYLENKQLKRRGEEQGSATWGTYSEAKNFKNLDEADKNILLTKNYGIATERPSFNLRYDRNLNVIVVGGSGSGKTRFYVKPNLLQLSSNYFVTDPKGTALLETGDFFKTHGYDIRTFNTIEFDQSLCYNPLQYVKTDAQLLSFVNCLIKNTSSDKKGGGDPFWEKAEQLLYVALLAYLRDWCRPEDYTLPSLVTLLSLAEASESNENAKSPLDLIFEQIETGYTWELKKKTDTFSIRPSRQDSELVKVPSKLVNNKTHKSLAEEVPEYDFALSNYRAFKTAAGKTLKSIIISCNVRLKPLEIHEVSELLKGAPDENGKPTGRCEMALDELGDSDKRIIIFGILSDTDKTFSFLFAILMWQAINVLCDKALKEYHGRLPRLVHFIFDEFANIGLVPDIDQTIAVTRSRNIAITLMLQSLSQLKARYEEDAAKVIVDCCDTMLFLGGKSNDTNKEISDSIGQETLLSRTYNQSKGQSASTSINNQIQGRALIDAAEVAKMPRDEAIVLIAGTNPLRDKKYPLELHPRYQYIDPGHSTVRVGKKLIKAEFSKDFNTEAYIEEKRKRENEVYRAKKVQKLRELSQEKSQDKYDSVREAFSSEAKMQLMYMLSKKYIDETGLKYKNELTSRLKKQLDSLESAKPQEIDTEVSEQIDALANRAQFKALQDDTEEKLTDAMAYDVN